MNSKHKQLRQNPRYLMNKHLQQALKHLEDANYSGYFEEMDKVEMPKYLKPIYAEHKSKFMQGLRTHDFSQQLNVFAGEVDKELDNESFVGIRETIDFTIRRLKTLEKHIAEAFTLLEETETQERLATTPNERKRMQLEMTYIRENLKKFEAEYKDLCQTKSHCQDGKITNYQRPERFT
jgi:hypothetical protein